MNNTLKKLKQENIPVEKKLTRELIIIGLLLGLKKLKNIAKSK